MAKSPNLERYMMNTTRKTIKIDTNKHKVETSQNRQLPIGF